MHLSETLVNTSSIWETLTVRLQTIERKILTSAKIVLLLFNNTFTQQTLTHSSTSTTKHDSLHMIRQTFTFPPKSSPNSGGFSSNGLCYILAIISKVPPQQLLIVCKAKGHKNVRTSQCYKTDLQPSELAGYNTKENACSIEVLMVERKRRLESRGSSPT